MIVSKAVRALLALGDFAGARALSKPPKAKARPNAVNRVRKAREFKRTMHSVARVKFVQSLPCLVGNRECQYYDGHSVNMHVVDDGSKGGSRKAGYRCIAPGCDFHHSLLDTQVRRAEFEQRYGVDLQGCADDTEFRWQRSRGTEECA